jgi:hypothetical protein
MDCEFLTSRPLDVFRSICRSSLSTTFKEYVGDLQREEWEEAEFCPLRTFMHVDVTASHAWYPKQKQSDERNLGEIDRIPWSTLVTRIRLILLLSRVQIPDDN